MDAAAAAAASTAAAVPASASPTPSPEDKARYEAARKDLMQALQKKRFVDRQLATLEVQIYNFEGSYLSETAQHSGGNIIHGFDGYLKTQSVGRRRHEPTEADRVFSNSSLSYQKSIDLLQEVAEDPDNFGFGALPPLPQGHPGNQHHPNQLNANGSLALMHPGNSNSRGPTPGVTSIFLPPPTSTPSSSSQRYPGGGGGSSDGTQVSNSALTKKERDRAYQRRKRASAAKEKEKEKEKRAQQVAAQTNGMGGMSQGSPSALGSVASTSGSVPMEGIEREGSATSESVSAAVSTARGRVTKKPRQADDD